MIICDRRGLSPMQCRSCSVFFHGAGSQCGDCSEARSEALLHGSQRPGAATAVRAVTSIVAISPAAPPAPVRHAKKTCGRCMLTKGNCEFSEENSFSGEWYCRSCCDRLSHFSARKIATFH